MTEPPVVELDGVRKVFGAVVAVDDVSLQVETGRFVVLLGPSGSGKTTILSVIGGFELPTAGRIRIAGRDVTYLPAARRPTATVFQDYALFPHLNVEDNVKFGLAMQKMPRPERNRRAGEVLAMVGLGDLARRRVHELSGGQRQRVALARAIAVQPTLLLLDEPLGALDLKIRRQMQDELTRIQHELGTTFIHVTHDQDEAMSIADTIVVVNGGRIQDMGSPQRIYLRPANRFVATFMGESNVVPCTVVDATGGEVSLDSPLGRLVGRGEAPIGAVRHVSLRPEHLRLGPTDGDSSLSLGRAVVSELTFQGAHVRVRARGGQDQSLELTLRVPAEVEVATRQTVDLHVRRDDVTVLAD